uniref:Uncharacterized protein, isoform A n=1 Tax=Drosophila melanogaster TaxID=7227 RepID=Q4ABI9_DROME|nr:uncharacterized protein Dmel_CG33725, isoform A [Drosophila melanogaster]AAZ66066.3 uncharacterized protein Dmel_CG33725, isoform A [Drosophila melanogaster]|eukprot:NP_001027125.1 uncharacterized protein Dmel_CG33725, isoform A [Drosophila melanogaster]
MLSKLVTSILCVAVGILVIDLNDAVVFKFTNFACLSRNQSWFVFHNCRLKAVSREKVLLNFNGTVLHPANNIIVHVKLFKKANGFKPWLLDVKLDACRFVRTNFHPFVRIIFDLFKDFSTINHTCPYVGLQVVKDFYLRPEKLKLPFPSGDYLLSLIWIFDKRPQFDTNVSFVYAEDLINA